MSPLLNLLITILGMLSSAVAQDTASVSSEKIWGSVVFTVPGEAPWIHNPPILTSVGEKQASAAGQMIRRRYIDGEGDNVTSALRISRLAQNDTKDVLDHRLLDIMSTDDQPVVGTALSFMQGLYPPLINRGNRNLIQWPSIKAVTTDDYKYNWLDGAKQCSNHQVARARYTNTTAYNTTQYETYPYYQSLTRLLGLPSAYLAYTNAPTIASIAEYEHANNATFAKQFSQADVDYLRYLASENIWAKYGRYSQASPIPVIGGRMLAGKILGQLTNQISSATSGAPLSLLFGPAESLISFYSISGLAAKEEFHQIPLPGSVLVFELFSDAAVDPLKNRVLLDSTKVYVRALIRNGTADSEPLRTVSLFYRNAAASKMPWKEFNKEMMRIAVQSPLDWCTKCETLTTYCAGLLVGSDTTKKIGGNSSPQASLGKGCGKISPLASGFIGALIATILLMVATAMIASCTSGHLAAWRKRRRDGNAEAGAGSELSTRDSKAGYFGWLKRASISKRERGMSDPDVDDRSPDGKQPKTNSWELRTTTTSVAGDEVPISPGSPVPLSEAATEERLKSRKDYAKSEAERDDDDEAAVNGLGKVVPRRIV